MSRNGKGHGRRKALVPDKQVEDSWNRTFGKRKVCIECFKEATYDSPDDLCDEHWIDWWVKDMKKDGFTDEQIAEYRKEIESVVAKNYESN